MLPHSFAHFILLYTWRQTATSSITRCRSPSKTESRSEFCFSLSRVRGVFWRPKIWKTYLFLNFWFSSSTLALPFWREAVNFLLRKWSEKKFSTKPDTFQLLLRHLIFWSVSHRLYTNYNISKLYYYNIRWRMMKYCRIIDHYFVYQYI